MLDRQILLCLVVIPPILVGLVILLVLRARDRNAATTFRVMRDLLLSFSSQRVAVAPDSTRTPAPKFSSVSIPRMRGDRRPLLAEDRAALARELCPMGPRPAREILADIGFEVETLDLPVGAPTLVQRDLKRGQHVVLVRDDERMERSLLEAVASIMLERVGRVATLDDVQALASELSRPRAVRSAGFPSPHVQSSAPRRGGR